MFLGFVLIVLMIFSGEIKFYPSFIAIMVAGIIFFISNWIFHFFSSKVWKISAFVFLILCIVAVIVFEQIDAYHSSFETMEDQEADLYLYQPFTNESSLATLENPATFKMGGELLVLDGATALYPLYAAFAQATYPEKEYDMYMSEVMVSTTPDAYQNLIHGVADIIFVAGPSVQQLEDAKAQGVELEMTPIGREAFVFFVNAGNPVEGLSVQQIQDIYSGEVKNWNELGGKNEKIRAFQRPEDSGSQTALVNLMGRTPIVKAPREDVVSGMGGIIEQTANYRNYPNAIGYSFRYFSMEMVQNDAIRHLEIDGVFPSEETIRNGTYPLASEFYAITAGSDNPNIEPFLQWILSPQGQSLVEKTGYVPINNIE
ncbi:hypothetical protein CWR45_07090 [Oceanobacillus chungangensis]|uniref:PBP domain-containing protein n=2 Tax=Oceanobacillus chungangensis TaxID=1229152 RepID=A0A3D8PW45_9BACI|nr:hypothetical protein CWR45_07090 [Oceanobacillus chungangensis]